MKKIWMLAAFGLLYFGAEAQTNRTYRTDMQDQRIMQNQNQSLENSARNVNLNTGVNDFTEPPVKINKTSQYQGYSANRQLIENNQTWQTIATDELPYRSIPYDTTKNNGHCIGCGSGTLTDPHFGR